MIEPPEYEIHVDGRPEVPPVRWRLEWDDQPSGVGRLVDGERSVAVVVEGGPTDWTVTIGGRRIPVAVRSWRERLLAEAEGAARAHSGPLTVKATLPGLVVSLAVEPGTEVAEGDRLLTIEAMKMQNEVRAPRHGRIVEVLVAAGQAVATATPLVTLE